MRKFTVRHGNFAGEHVIYDSIASAREHGIKDIQVPWYNNNTVTGSWCQSDDGFVVQCLNRYKLKNKKHISGQYTDCFRFPMGTVYVYHRKDGTLKIKNLYTNVTTTNKSALSDAGILGKYMTAKKRLFVSFVADGMSPYHAYTQAFREGYPSNVYIQTNKLLMDPIVRKALMEEMKPIITKIDTAVMKKTGLNLSDYLVDQIVSVMTDSKATNRDRRENIKLALALFGEQLGLKPPSQSLKEKKREVEDAEYEVVRPPSLGPI